MARPHCPIHPGNLCCGKEAVPPGGLDPSRSCHDSVSRTPLDRHGKLEHLNAQTGARGIIGKDSHKAGGVLSPHRGNGISCEWEEMAGYIGSGDNAVTMWLGPSLLGARKCPGTDTFDSVNPRNLPCLDSWVSSKNSQGFLRDNIPLPKLPFLLSHISYMDINCIL